MSESILDSVKKVLGLSADYTAFDQDIIMHINSTFATLNQLGIGPDATFMIVDSSTTWDDFLGVNLKYNSVKTYMYLKVRMIFDPPGTSYLIAAFKEMIREEEWRLNVIRESAIWLPPVVALDVMLDGGTAAGG